MRDQLIIDELRKGNQSIFGVLHEYYSPIESHVIQNKGSKHDAKDIFQNALIIFYKKAIVPDFELNAKISTYLFGVSKNLWLNQLRSRKRKENTTNINEPSEELKIEIGSDDFDLEVYITNKIEQLGDPCLTLLIMHTYKKLSMDQIAKELGYANNHTARQQKYKCLQRLKKSIPFDDIKQYIS